jgi:hypothetical protein
MPAPVQLQAWNAKVSAYVKSHGGTRKDAMIALKGSPRRTKYTKKSGSPLRMKKAHCRKPNQMLGAKCYKPCSPSKKGVPRLRSPATKRCNKISPKEMKKLMKTKAGQKKIAKALFA